MGLEFGNLTRTRHVISYSLSPFEQRAFPNYFSKGIPNVLRRTRERILRVAPRLLAGIIGIRQHSNLKCTFKTAKFMLAFVAFYLIYTWANQEFEQSRRKNPAMYENDK